MILDDAFPLKTYIMQPYSHILVAGILLGIQCVLFV